MRRRGPSQPRCGCGRCGRRAWVGRGARDVRLVPARWSSHPLSSSEGETSLSGEATGRSSTQVSGLGEQTVEPTMPSEARPAERIGNGPRCGVARPLGSPPRSRGDGVRPGVLTALGMLESEQPSQSHEGPGEVAGHGLDSWRQFLLRGSSYSPVARR